jgi:hypothetical protein
VASVVKRPVMTTGLWLPNTQMGRWSNENYCSYPTYYYVAGISSRNGE